MRLFIKDGNKSCISQNVDLVLKGLGSVNSKGQSAILAGKPGDENSIAELTNKYAC